MDERFIHDLWGSQGFEKFARIHEEIMGFAMIRRQDHPMNNPLITA